MRQPQSRFFIPLLSLLCTAAAGLPGVAAAQTTAADSAPAGIAVKASADPAPAAAASGTSATQIAEVVVTATKRATPVREIPASINVITGADLERKGVQSIDEVMKLVPGVAFSNDAQDAERISIRGISSTQQTNLTTGVMIGDVPFADPYITYVSLDPNPFDMARVEVLKGPQGTLFGGTGLNGAIRYVPEMPDFKAWQAKYYAQYSGYPGHGRDGMSYGAVANAPLLGDTLALRLVGFHRNAPGYVDSIEGGNLHRNVNSTSQYGLRGILGWHPDDDGRWNIDLTYIVQGTRKADYDFADNFYGQLQRSDTPKPSPTNSRYEIASLAVEYRFDWAKVVAETSATEKKFLGNEDFSELLLNGQLPLLTSGVFDESRALMQEVRLVSPSELQDWKWLVGAFEFHQLSRICTDLALATTDLLGGTALPLGGSGLPSGLAPQPCEETRPIIGDQLLLAHVNPDVMINETALFGELTRKLFDRVEITLGGRAYWTSTGGEVTSGGALEASGGAGLTVLQGEQVIQGLLRERGFNPKASIVYKPTRDIFTYVSASKGYRFGGLEYNTSNVQTTVPKFWKSDSVWNYEAGIRTQWFHRTLQADTSVYYIPWKNPQLAQTTSLITYTANVGGARSEGVETQLKYRVPFIPGLALSSAAAYGVTTTTQPFTTIKGNQTAPGTTWPLSPKWQISSAIGYQTAIDDLDLGGQLIHTLCTVAYPDLDHSAPIFGYQTFDANLNLGSVSREWIPELTVALTNITNARGKQTVNAQATAVAGINASQYNNVNYIPPRGLMLRLNGRF